MRNIEAKMAAFTDAGLYAQDAHIDFEPEGHIYLCDGCNQLLPVSSLVGYFFEPSMPKHRLSASGRSIVSLWRRRWRSGSVSAVWPVRWAPSSTNRLRTGSVMALSRPSVLSPTRERRNWSTWSARSSSSSVSFATTMSVPIVRSGPSTTLI